MVVKINGEKKEVPCCYAELTTKQYQRIVSEWDFEKPIEDRDFFALFNIITDNQFTHFENTPENEVTVWNVVRWIVEEPFQFSKELPKVLVINGKIIDIPKDIRALSIGQNIMLKQTLSKSKVMEANLAEAVAIYIQPLYDGKKFNGERAKELIKEIEQLPAHIVYPIGFFLFKNVLKHGNGQMNFLKRIKTNLMARLSRALLNSHRLTGYMRMLT